LTCAKCRVHVRRARLRHPGRALFFLPALPTRPRRPASWAHPDVSSRPRGTGEAARTRRAADQNTWRAPHGVRDPGRWESGAVAAYSRPEGRSTIVQHIAAVLSDGGKICVRCVASDAGVPTSELPPYVQIVASSILITMDRGRCRLCGREDTRLSFGETSRWGGRSWLG